MLDLGDGSVVAAPVYGLLVYRLLVIVVPTFLHLEAPQIRVPALLSPLPARAVAQPISGSRATRLPETGRLNLHTHSGQSYKPTTEGAWLSPEEGRIHGCFDLFDSHKKRPVIGSS